MTPQKTRIKICGISNETLAYEAACLGADYIGLVFHPQSKRAVSLEQAKRLVPAIKKGGAIPVAVCVSQEAKTLLKICALLDINHIQLHGDLSRSACQHLPKIIKKIYALAINPEGQLYETDQGFFQYLSKEDDYLLFDGPSAGSGCKINVDNLSDLARGFPYFIAGGLNAENVKTIIQKTNPFGVDVSSSLENNKGEKTLTALRNFIFSARKKGEHHA
jgi:phosphoribosylanthranilate isomerase